MNREAEPRKNGDGIMAHGQESRARARVPGGAGGRRLRSLFAWASGKCKEFGPMFRLGQKLKGTLEDILVHLTDFLFKII